jgi:hypothetical protein
MLQNILSCSMKYSRRMNAVGMMMRSAIVWMMRSSMWIGLPLADRDSLHSFKRAVQSLAFFFNLLLVLLLVLLLLLSNLSITSFDLQTRQLPAKDSSSYLKEACPFKQTSKPSHANMARTPAAYTAAIALVLVSTLVQGAEARRWVSKLVTCLLSSCRF